MKYNIQTDLSFIANDAEHKRSENEVFRDYLKLIPDDLDVVVQEINAKIETLVDCTLCGNCCRSLMINVTAEEADHLAKRLGKPLPQVKQEFLEESTGGQLVINTIPCHFLADNKCTIYADRFSDCKAFPHLDKPGFRQRIFGTLMHFGRCPIIYNVMEELKLRTNFTPVHNTL
ncbi:YkgJ family cysteine cluster protein [Flavihumibacter fluvii]|uniref:YkgJ family cysteine cluster protein n=1 Tax=Flavihumibacter fluvii TaxID=2838157 RepID=UPI001BDDF7F8|nr:YkgJ family cysteine cluster protein [Flavihumibacter fluvii]ULQ53850.1 YkgJ family cysteine cluster protein [Flavihumibacter fluvii]